MEGYFSLTVESRNNFAPWTNCFSLSFPRSPAPCKTRTSGYFFDLSYPSGNNILYGSTEPSGEVYSLFSNIERSWVCALNGDRKNTKHNPTKERTVYEINIMIRHGYE